MRLKVRLSTSNACWFFVDEKDQQVGGILRHGAGGLDAEQIARRMVELWNADQESMKEKINE
jgi:hypothetical protein